jgi:hypothetical protein
VKHFSWALIFCLLSPALLLASGDPVPMGGRSWALANASLTLADEWAVYNNVGGLARLRENYLGAACDVRYGMTGLTTVALAGVLPLAFGTCGISLDRFGDELYNEQRFGIAYGHQVDRVSLGFKASYVQTAIANLGARGRFVFEFGGIAELTPQLWLGASVYNFTQARLASYDDERIPTVLRAGLSWRPLPQLMLNAETEKDVDYTARFRGGIEYQLAKPFFVRVGIATDPGTNHFGFGFKRNKLWVDYSLRTHPTLGLSHHLSLSYKLNQRKKDAGRKE